MKILNSMLVALVVLCLSVQGDEKPRGTEKAAEDFAFEKTKLGTTLDSFMKRFPRALKNAEKSKERIGFVWVVRYDCDAASTADYFFLDGELFSIEATYNPDKLERLDYGKVLAEKMIEKLGPQTMGDLDARWLQWTFAKQNRRFRWSRDDGAAHLEMTDTRLYDEYAKRLAKFQRSGPTGID